LNYILYLVIALILSLLPFSVALSSSVYRCIVWKEALRIAMVFAVFQLAMLATGWAIGNSVKGLLTNMAVPVAVMIIFIIGVRLFLDSRRLGWEHRTISEEKSRILLGFAFVISINTALLGMGIGILYPDILILGGLVFAMVFLMTIAGIQAGKRGMINLGQTAEMAGGAGLIVISVIIILQYLKIL